MSTESQLLERKLWSRMRQLEPHLYTAHAPIGQWRTAEGPRYLDGGVPQPDARWETIEPGYRWTPSDTRWFLSTAVVPDDWQGGPLLARLRLGGEAQVFVNGHALQGIYEVYRAVSVRDEVMLAEQAVPGSRYEIAVEATSIQCWGPASSEEQTVSLTELALPDPAVRDLYYWLRVCLDAAALLGEESTERLRLIRLLDQSMQALNLRRAGTPQFSADAERASAQIQKALAQLPPSASAGSIRVMGNSHLDTAWLWPLSETERKCGRTFSNALSLLDRYPDFLFLAGEPQHYAFTKRLFPDLYERIKQRIAEGRWEVVGSSWIENDCNIPSGESLIRQYLYGRRFLRQEFGVDSTIAWYVDTFGYTWSLPQILAHCGMDAFYTEKMSWNETDRFPYGVFWWQGLDGTRVLAAQIPTVSVGEASPERFASTWKQFPERDRFDECFTLVGYGDGGGGPIPQDIEYCRRMANLVGVPRTRFGRVSDYYAKLRKLGDSLPTWNDELYLELHRGCQTSQARTKMCNRKLELLLRDVEQLAVVAGAWQGVTYPADELRSIWERVLLYQFHDVLPGTAIRQVYAEAEQDYAELTARAESMRSSLLKAIAAKLDTRGDGAPVVVFNTLSWQRRGIVEVELDLPPGESFEAISPDGVRTPCQVLEWKGNRSRMLFHAQGIPSFGYAVYHIVPATASSPTRSSLSATPLKIENAHLRVRFDRAGRILSVYDKDARREVLAPSKKANLLQFFDDRPRGSTAWDIDPWFEEQSWEANPAEVEVVETGPLRMALRMTYRGDKHTITQEVRLAADSRRLDFVTHVDWHERLVLLKCAFPVDVHASRATYEIQFGAIERPTHSNTSWERAKFEVPAHRWADLSEHGYGVALLNDCKYGYDVRGNVLRLSLLRSPTSPDPEADQGEHDFAYALYPHAGPWQDSGVVREGLDLNVPLLALSTDAHDGGLLPAGSALATDCTHVVVDTLKQAEDGDGLILRLYEAHGGRGPVSVDMTLPVVSAVECNGLEDEIGPADFRHGRLHMTVRPWQLRSFRLRMTR